MHPSHAPNCGGTDQSRPLRGFLDIVLKCRYGRYDVPASHSDYAEYDVERAHPSVNPVEFKPTIVLVRLRRSLLW